MEFYKNDLEVLEMSWNFKTTESRDILEFYKMT